MVVIRYALILSLLIVLCPAVASELLGQASIPPSRRGSIERLRRKMRIEPVSVGPAYLNRITLNFLSLMR